MNYEILTAPKRCLRMTKGSKKDVALWQHPVCKLNRLPKSKQDEARLVRLGRSVLCTWLSRLTRQKQSIAMLFDSSMTTSHHQNFPLHFHHLKFCLLKPHRRCGSLLRHFLISFDNHEIEFSQQVIPFCRLQDF